MMLLYLHLVRWNLSLITGMWSQLPFLNLIHDKEHPTQQSRESLKKARSSFQHEARQCANQYGQDICTRILTAADSGNIRQLYNGNIRQLYDVIKCTLGHQHRKSPPIMSSDNTILHDIDKQLGRWAEYYYELYSSTSSLPSEVVQSISSFPTLRDLDASPTIKELEDAIDALKHSKAPGEDNIPLEVIKYCKFTLHKPLHDFLLAGKVAPYLKLSETPRSSLCCKEQGINNGL